MKPDCCTLLVTPHLIFLIFKLGHQIAIRNIVNQKISFIPIPDFVDHITHIALSPNKKNLFVCEQHVHNPQSQGEIPKNDVYLSIYDLKNPD